jgi:magnesium-transporting ATPase (P-type)
LGLTFIPLVYSENGNALYLLLSVFSLGIFAIICNKYPFVGSTIRFQKGTFQNATHIIITGTREGGFEAPVKHEDGIRFFEYKKQRFVYRDHFWAFVIQNATLVKTPSQLHQMRLGKSTEDAIHQSKLSGKNQILIDDTPVFSMIALKCSEAFYLFQMASVSIWVYIGYTTYAILILIMSIFSIAWEVYQAKTNEEQLRSLTKQEAQFYVLRDGVPHRVASEDLVIGDIVLLDYSTTPQDTKLPCDMVLIQGECVVDESSLTGETIPILKIPLPKQGEGDERVDIDRNKGNVLFGGSTIKQLKPRDDRFRTPTIVDEQHNILKTSTSADPTAGMNTSEVELHQLPSKNGSVLAIVFSTGFSTAKGQLFRSILFPSDIV